MRPDRTIPRVQGRLYVLLVAVLNLSGTVVAPPEVQATQEPVFPYSLPQLVDQQLVHHGYFYKQDLLSQPNDLEFLREFCDTLVYSLFDLEDLTSEVIRNLVAGEFCNLPEDLLLGARERIQMASEAGFVMIGELPLYGAIRFGTETAYRNGLKQLQECLPEIRLLDYVYFWDEPDINDPPDTDTLTRYIAAFKEAFPSVKVTCCYAIGQERFLDVVPPENVDLLMIDPYFPPSGYEHTAADFETFFRRRLALALDWVNRWRKPYFLVGDSIASIDPGGRSLPAPEAARWYYQIALTQPSCQGLLWFQYGYLKTPEAIKGVKVGEDASEPLLEEHRRIGKLILGDPSPLGLPGTIAAPPLPDFVHEALEAGTLQTEE